MMIKWMPVALALVLTACSSTSETRYYQLPTLTAASTAVSGQAQMRPLWVEHVAVPDSLAGNGVVYQTSDVQYVIASSNLWASPLDQQLQQTLVSNLSAALPGALVTTTQPSADHDTLNVTVTGFQGRYDGQVVVSGAWVLEHNGQLRRQSFAITLPQSEDGYDAMVRTLAQGWLQASRQMANAIAAQP